MAAPLTNEERLRRAIPEASVSSVFEDWFTWTDWWWHHETDSRLSPSGLPDLNAWHHRGWSAHLEVKKERGELRPAQYIALDTMSCGHIEPFDKQMDHLWVSRKLRRVVAIVRPRTQDLVLDQLKELLGT